MSPNLDHHHLLGFMSIIKYQPLSLFCISLRICLSSSTCWQPSEPCHRLFAQFMALLTLTSIWNDSNTKKHNNTETFIFLKKPFHQFEVWIEPNESEMIPVACWMSSANKSGLIRSTYIGRGILIRKLFNHVWNKNYF